MPFRLSVPDNTDYIYLAYSGLLHDVELEEARLQRNQLAVQQGLVKLLIDIRDVRNRPTISGLMRTTTAQMSGGLPRLRTALLAKPGQSTEFVSTMAISHNYPLAIFTDLASAQDWLDL